MGGNIMNLKRILATAVMATSAVAIVPAIAQGMPKLSDAEKITLKKSQDFAVCTKKSEPKIMDKVKQHIEGIMSSRVEATRKALLSAGLPDETAGQIAGAMSHTDTQAVMQLLIPSLIANESQPFMTKCAKDLGIGNDKGFSEEFQKARQALTEKYGPKIFEIPAAPKPQLKPA